MWRAKGWRRLCRLSTPPLQTTATHTHTHITDAGPVAAAAAAMLWRTVRLTPNYKLKYGNVLIIQFRTLLQHTVPCVVCRAPDSSVEPSDDVISDRQHCLIMRVCVCTTPPPPNRHPPPTPQTAHPVSAEWCSIIARLCPATYCIVN